MKEMGVGKRKREERGKVDYVPQEIWNEIILRLPARMVLPLKLFCKTFNSIISHHNFAPLHFPKHKKTNGCQLILIDKHGGVINARLISYDPNHFIKHPLYTTYSNSTNSSFQQLAVVLNESYKIEVVGNVHGLLLLHEFKSPFYKWDSSNTLILWNPLTGKVFHIPNSSFSLLNCWCKQVEVAFGYDIVNHDYKIVVFILKPNSIIVDHPKHQAVVEIFSLKRKTWKIRIVDEIEAGIDFCVGPKVLLNGEIHWVVGTDLHPHDNDYPRHDDDPFNGLGDFTSLMSFNLATDLFTCRNLPDLARGQVTVPAVYQGSLLLVSVHRREIGIWKLDIANQLWTSQNHCYNKCLLFSSLSLGRVLSSIYMVTAEGRECLLFSLCCGIFLTFFIADNKIVVNEHELLFREAFVESLLSPPYPFAT